MKTRIVTLVAALFIVAGMDCPSGQVVPSAFDLNGDWMITMDGATGPLVLCIQIADDQLVAAGGLCGGSPLTIVEAPTAVVTSNNVTAEWTLDYPDDDARLSFMYDLSIMSNDSLTGSVRFFTPPDDNDAIVETVTFERR